MPPPNFLWFFLQILLLKRAVNKFKGQVNDALSTASDERKVSIRSGIGSPSALRTRLFDRINSSRSAVGDKFGASGSGAIATSVLFNSSPPSSTSHQSRWTTALIESRGETSPTSNVDGFARRGRKKSATGNRPTSPFEMPSPEASMPTERRVLLFDKQEIVDNGVEIQQSLNQLETKLEKLEALIVNLMGKFPMPPADGNHDSNV